MIHAGLLYGIHLWHLFVAYLAPVLALSVNQIARLAKDNILNHLTNIYINSPNLLRNYVIDGCPKFSI